MAATLRVGFSVEFTHDTLRNFEFMDAARERALREEYLAVLWGARAADFAARFSGGWPTQATPDDGHLGGAEAFRVATDVVAAFNALATGTTLTVPDPEPHCVRYEWIDGKLVVTYNYLVELAATTNGSAPPGGAYHVVVCSDAP